MPYSEATRPRFSFHRCDDKYIKEELCPSNCTHGPDVDENDVEFCWKQIFKGCANKKDFEMELRWYDGIMQYESPCIFTFDADKNELYVHDYEEEEWRDQFGQNAECLYDIDNDIGVKVRFEDWDDEPIPCAVLTIN